VINVLAMKVRMNQPMTDLGSIMTITLEAQHVARYVGQKVIGHSQVVTYCIRRETAITHEQ